DRRQEDRDGRRPASGDSQIRAGQHTDHLAARRRDEDGDRQLRQLQGCVVMMTSEKGELMPIVFRVNHDARVVVASAYGVLTDTEVFRYQREVWSRTDVAGFDELMDMTRVTRVELPSADRVRELAKLAAEMDSTTSRSRFAIVASADFAFGIGRMFQAHRHLEENGTKEVGVFRTMQEALAFLRVDRPLTIPAFA